MSGIQQTGGPSPKKRKYEDDTAPPAQRKKRSKSESKRNKHELETRKPQTPIPQNTTNEETIATSRKRNVRNDDSDTKRPVEPTVHDIVGSAEPTLTKSERRKQKKEARKLARQYLPLHEGVGNGNIQNKTKPGDGAAMPVSQQTTGDRAQRKAERKRAKALQSDTLQTPLEHSRSKKVAKSSTPSWTLSQPAGGRFLDHDPVFVQDVDGQDYIIAANDREVQLLSLETSLVIRTLPAPNGASVLCYAAEDRGAANVHITYSNGTVCKWDWTSDVYSVRNHNVNGTIKAISLAQCADNNEPSFFHISSLGGESAISNSGRVLHRTKHQLHAVQVLDNAEYIIAQGPSMLVLGVRKDMTGSLIEFIWTEIPLNMQSTCFDARLLPARPSTKRHSTRPGLRLAIGHETGQIHLYEDVSTIFKQNGKEALGPPRILHWHRDAVSSVKFSADGNYLISGGKETVLVLWQLETGTKQYLPHLTSEIERIVVNPKGDRYALQMGDNSIMVLNTSELKPVANFAGLQMPTRTKSMHSKVPSAHAATLHPKYPHQLLMAVPSTRPKTAKDISTRPFLQAFDLRNSRHITRQALTRNNVTDFNLGPERTPIIPPDVEQLAISYDGSWLATIDEWTPPASDLEHLASDNAGLEMQQQTRREVYLKFWNWDEHQALWTLTTRVDSPHARSTAHSMGSGRVLALTADPASNGFATIGEDSCVKVWKPRTRTRHGVALKDKADSKLVEWICKRTTQVVSNTDRADSPMETFEESRSVNACLAYCADGSMLATSRSMPETSGSYLDVAELPIVHFINTITGDLISKPGLAKHEVTSVGFVDRYFIAVTKPGVYVWDLVNDSLMYKINFSISRAPESLVEPLLAVNDGDGTFAVITHLKRTGHAKVEVYAAREPRCLYEQDFNTQIEAILASKGARGYTLIFADATIRTLSSGAASHASALQDATQESAVSEPPTEQITNVAVPSDMVADLEMEDVLASSVAERDRQRTIVEEEDDRPVVRPEQLATVFDTTQSFAMPPVKDMFEAVVNLFARRPHVKLQVEVEE